MISLNADFVGITNKYMFNSFTFLFLFSTWFCTKAVPNKRQPGDSPRTTKPKVLYVRTQMSCFAGRGGIIMALRQPGPNFYPVARDL